MKFTIQDYTWLQFLNKRSTLTWVAFVYPRAVREVSILNSYSVFMSNAESCKMNQVVWLQLTAAYCVICIIIVCSIIDYYNLAIFEPRGRTDSLCLLLSLWSLLMTHVASVHSPALFGVKYKSISCHLFCFFWQYFFVSICPFSVFERRWWRSSTLVLW